MGALRQTRSMPRPSNLADAFTALDRRRLVRALRGASAARVYRRTAAVLAVAEGRSVAESARQFRVDRTTVHRWVVAYLAARDPDDLADGERRGRPPSGDISARRLAAILCRDPRTLGYRSTTWTVDLLAAYCAERLGRSITPRTLRRRLHQHGFRWKRPRYTYSERASHLAQKKGLSAVA
jgi:transposase